MAKVRRRMKNVIAKNLSKIPFKIKFSVLEFTFWCSWCAFSSFAALFFRHRGLSEGQIGLALSFSTLAGILGQLFWGTLCDRKDKIKGPFMAANLLIGLTTLAFIPFRHPLIIFCLKALLGFAQVPQPAILDTWVLRSLKDQEKQYGHIRMWASLGFGLFAFLFGRLLEFTGFSALFIASSIFIGLTLFMSSLTGDVPRDNSGNKKDGLLKSFKKLIRERRYRFFIGVCFLIGLSARTVHLLLPLLVEKAGGTSRDLGLALFFGIITEIPMLLLSKRLAARFNSRVLIGLSVLLYLGQLGFLLFASSPFFIYVAMVLQGLAFGNYLPSFRLLIYESSPEELRTSAQTLGDSLCSSLTAVIGTAAGGFVIESHGVTPVLIGGLVLLGIALILLFFYREKEVKTKSKQVLK